MLIKGIACPDARVVQIEIELPVGKTAKELAVMFTEELKNVTKTPVTFGKVVRLTGRMTTGMAAVAGHILSHICTEIQMLDPKENKFYTVVKH